MLAAVGLDAFFGERLVIGAECARAKPHPEPYLEGLRRLGVAAEQSLAFEDSPSGMAAAVAAGLATFGVQTTQAEDILLASGAAAVVRDFRDARLWAAMGEAPPASFIM
jgi:beta-phosphoglucomutase-like phosphatase (HAD superfamily)